MDDAAFDRAAREAAVAPRRAALRGLAGLAALGALAAGRPGQEAAAAKRDKDGKKGGGDGNGGDDGDGEGNEDGNGDGKDNGKGKGKGKGKGGGAKAAKKRNGAAKGTLVRVDIVTSDPVSINPGETRDATAACDEPGGKETVQVLGGGFNVNNDALLVFRAEAVTTPATGYRVDAAYPGSAGSQLTFTAQAICGYFRK